MKSASFANFQVGMVVAPSVEDQGGFEFASGMDMFSEPGVMKASHAMEAISLGSGVTLDALPTHLVRPPVPFGGRIYFAMGDRILFQSYLGDLTEYLTNSEGTIDGLAAWGDYLVYTAANNTHLGRVSVSSGDPAGDKDDTVLTLSGAPSSGDSRAMIIQAGTLKITSYRFIGSLDVSFALKSQALKLPDTTQAIALANYANKPVYRFKESVQHISTCECSPE